MSDADREGNAQEKGCRRFEGMTALVSAAGRGIGAATAKRIHDEGGTVVVTDRTREAAEDVVSALGGADRTLHAAKLDVISPRDWDDAVETVLAFTGRLDVLHHNAGRNDYLSLDAMTDTFWRDQLALNLDSAMFGIRACLPSLAASGNGAIVLTSSVHAVQGYAGFPAYAAAKAGLIGLARQLAVDYAPTVRVNVVIPGVVETDAWSTMDAAERELWTRSNPARRITQPEDIAAAVAFLASPDAAAITGQSLVVDSGGTIFGRSGL
jgi:NAD(P)-dependent dehydrogenase (short-subunit alcohol dehydrogenase family)